MDAGREPSGGLRRRAAAAALLGAALAAIVIVVSSGGRLDDATFGDGVVYRYVAVNLASPPEDVDAFLGPRGTSLRYGRIGLPAMLWAASAGDAGAMRWAQPALMIASAAAIAAAAAVLFPGGGIVLALAPFVAVGVLASVAGGFAEAPAIAAGLWGVVAAIRGRIGWAAAAFAVALLTKESAVVALGGTIAWLAVRSRVRPAALLATAALPAAAWYGYVSARYGTFPPLDPWLRDTGSVDLPGVGFWRSITEPDTGPALLAAAHVVAAATVAFLARHSVWRWITVAGLALTLSTGPFVWGFLGDGIRNAAVTEVAVVLAFVVAIAPETAMSGTASQPARPATSSASR